MIKRGKKFLREHIQFLERNKIPFTIDSCHKSYVVRSGMGVKYFTDNYMNPETMQLTRKVRKHVKDNEIFNNYPKKDSKSLRIKYICFDKKMFGEKTTNIWEVDMDTAYWLTAKKLGIIDQEIFDKGMLLSSDDKRARLVPLGTLAKRVTRREFDGVKYSKGYHIDNSSETRHLWDLISSRVDKVMQKCMSALKNNFVFYWTDAVFFKATDNNFEIVKKAISDNGYGCKMVNNAWYEFRDDACYVFSPEKGKRLKTDEELKRIDYKWVRDNLDWDYIVPLINKKIESVINKIQTERTEQRLAKEKETGLRLPELKPMVIKQFSVSEIKKMNVDDFKRFVKKSFYVRNFCYSITNDNIWRKARKKKRSKSTKKTLALPHSN